MRVFKAGVFLSLAVAFSVACSTSNEGNTNAPNANQQSNANTRQVEPVIPSNSNASAPSANSNRAAAESRSSSPATADGAALFVAQKCVTCHGPDGKGKVKGTPSFTDAAWQKKESDADLTEDIKKGKPPKMPAFDTKLSDAEIKALVAYIRTFSGK